jgi:hypothetical protein
MGLTSFDHFQPGSNVPRPTRGSVSEFQDLELAVRFELANLIRRLEPFRERRGHG